MNTHSNDQQSKMVEMLDNLQADKYPLKKYKHIGGVGPRRVDGYQKASGKADYTMDIQLPGMLYMRFLDSPYAHARIKKLDTTRAELVPGVRCILRYDDPLLQARVTMGKMPAFFGNPPVLSNTAYFEGEPFGVAIAAETEAIAEEALSLLDIEYEELPFVLDPAIAKEKGAPLSNPESFADTNHWNKGILDVLTQGDIKKGFAEADKIIEFTYRRRGHTWVGPERPCGVVKWNGECPEVWVKQQRPMNVKHNMSHWYGGIPMNKIQLHMPYQGASFGGWIQMTWNQGPLYCAGLAAKRTGKPVKYVFTRREDFYGGSMDDGVYHVKAGFKKDGTITAVEGVQVLVNNLWPFFNLVGHLKENTRIPHLYGRTENINVNRGPMVPTRCEMLPTSLTLTMLFNKVAAELGMDPTEIALKNDGADGFDTNWLNEEKKKRNFPPIDSLKECIDKGKSAIQWDAKFHKPGAKKLPNGRMHGLGFAWTHEWDDSLGSSEMAIRIERTDGTASILGMGCDNGVDAENTYCRIAADELGFRLEDVNYNPQVDPGFFRMAPDSSTNATINGFAIRHAARILKEKILTAACSPSSVTQRGSYKPAFEGATADDLEIEDSFIFRKSNPSQRMAIADFVRDAGQSGPITIGETAGIRNAFSEPFFAFGYHVQEGSYNPHNPRPHFARQAHFMEVEVDTETGQIYVTRIVNVNDVGKVLNRKGAEGQQYGGSVMAHSRSQFEEMIYDPATGVMLNGNLLDYKIATILDISPIDTILLETGLGYGPYGSVGLGEDVGTVATGLLAPAVYNALGVWIDDDPITPEKILKALKKA